MRVYLPELKLKRGEPVEYTYRGSIPAGFGPESGAGQMSVFFTARAAGDKILIKGSLEAVFNAECSRCLQQFTQEIKAEFDESFTMVAGAGKDDDPEILSQEAANELTVSGDYLYLDDYLRQIFILTQEYKPLCRPDCKGLCPRCGADRNKDLCRCSGEEVEFDQRLRKLKELFPDS